MKSYCRKIKGDPRDLYNECLIAGFCPQAVIDEAFKPALDAEYGRQHPNGPTPIFTAKAGNPRDMELLARVFNRTALERAFGPGGGGMDEIERNAATARAEQDNGADAANIDAT